MNTAAQRAYGRIGFAAVVAGYVVLALAYSVVNPLFESPDELLHYEFARYLVDRHELPVQTPGKLTEFHQPPLYYVLTALVMSGIPADSVVPGDNPFWGYDAYRFGVDNKARYIHTSAEDFPYRGTALAAHAARGLSIALGVLSLIICYWILREVFSRSVLVFGALAFIAFNPQFIFVSSSISNDNLITLLGLALIWVSIRMVRTGPTWRYVLLTALLLAAAILTKLSAAILGLVPLLVILLAPVSWRKRFGMSAVVATLVGAVTGWWFLRNYMLYGDWTGIRTWQQIWGWQTAVTNWANTGIILHNIWTSYWGQFGLGQIVLPDWTYALLLIVNIASLIGLTWYWVRWRHTRVGLNIDRRGLGVLFVLLLAMFGASIWYGLANPTGAAGRFLLPAMVAIAGLMSLGLRSWYRLDSTAADRCFIVLCYGTMIALDFGALVGVIAPAYARPGLTTLEAVRAQTKPADIRFDGAVQLLGYAIDSDRVTAGGEISVKLCWQTLKPTATDVYFFLHLLGDNNAIIARRDSLHGLGRYPSSQWSPNQIFCDDVPLQVDKDAAGSRVYDLEVGLVDRSNGSRLPPINSAGVELRPAILKRIKVRAPQLDLSVPTSRVPAIDFGGQIRLLGSEIDRSHIRSGDTFSVTLEWQAARIPDADYTVFVHLLSASNQLVAQADAQPRQSTFPTSFWDMNESVVDTHLVTVPPDAPAGVYRVLVGLYILDTGQRVPVVGAGGDSVDIGWISIEDAP